MIRKTLARLVGLWPLLFVLSCGGSGGGSDGASGALPGAGGAELATNGGIGGGEMAPPGSSGLTNPASPLDPDADTDADGTSDVDEIACGSAVNGAASDCSNLDGDAQDNDAEAACGSDPESAASLSPDSDEDGRPDCLRGYPSLPMVGAPGAAVDCASTLPCTWVSADGSVEARVVFADGFFRLNRLDRGSGHGLSTVTTFVVNDRDATITLLQGAEATSEDGDRFTGRERLTPLGDTGGSASFGARDVDAFAGTPFRVRELFSEDVEGTGLLEELVLPFADNGTRAQAVFRNLPYGKAPSVERDCAGLLPCTWISADGVRAFTVESVGVNLDEQLELGVSYRTSAAGESVTMSVENASFNGDDFGVYEPLRLTLGGVSDLRVVTSPTPQGEDITGSLTTDVSRDAITAALMSLNRATVQLYDASETVPFYNPVFRNLPVAR